MYNIYHLFTYIQVNRVLQDVLRKIDGKIIPLSTLITPIRDLDCQERCHDDLLSYSDICDSENERIQRRGKVTLALPPSVFTNYHLRDYSSKPHTSHHLLCDNTGMKIRFLCTYTNLSFTNNSIHYLNYILQHTKQLSFGHSLIAFDSNEILS